MNIILSKSNSSTFYTHQNLVGLRFSDEIKIKSEFIQPYDINIIDEKLNITSKDICYGRAVKCPKIGDDAHYKIVATTNKSLQLPLLTEESIETILFLNKTKNIVFIEDMNIGDFVLEYFDEKLCEAQNTEYGFEPGHTITFANIILL